ncbi:MAG: LmeA family phospholipid-binding protein [Candidatus Cloacimonetes bacterium]|nr:LmeA family phospholipid-binding protein [Candidatus Cloacimonadota bacterium]
MSKLVIKLTLFFILININVFSSENRGFFQEIMKDPNSLKGKVTKAFEKYFKSPDKLKIKFYPTKKKSLMRGYFDRIDVTFQNAQVKVLQIENASIQFFGLKINLLKLYKSGQLRIKDLKEAKFRIKISEKALNDAIFRKKLPLKNPRLKIGNGVLAFKAHFRTLFIKSLVDTKGRLLVKEKSKVFFYPDRLKLNHLPIPGFVKKVISNKINPIINLDDFDFIKEISEIDLSDGYIELINK